MWLGGQALSGRRQAHQVGTIQVVGGRARELGLSASVVGRAVGQIEVGKLEVRLESAERLVEGRARNSGCLGLAPQALDPGIELGIGRGGR